MTHRKKLIEVALPLEAINVASAREKSIRHGHPSTLHLWWARRPLAAARAVIFASLVDDPDSADAPPEFVTACKRLPAKHNALTNDTPRMRLFDFIEDLVRWESTTDEQILNTARSLIKLSTNGNPPPLLDPFAGGGSIPLEAQRLGLEAHASDLNPVAVMINKAQIEIPPRFAGRPPVNPRDRAKVGGTEGWRGAAGLAADVRYYGEWMREKAWERIGHLYPTYNGETVIAWLWARTVKSPNPAVNVHVPLVRSFELSKKKGRQAWVEPQIDPVTQEVSFRVYNGEGKAPPGTIDRRGGRCIVSGTPIPFEYIRAEGKAGRMGATLMAIVTEGANGRNYYSPNPQHEKTATTANGGWYPGFEISHWPGRTNVVEYGLTQFGDLFTARQLVALNTFSELVPEAQKLAFQAAKTIGLPDDDIALRDGGCGARAYCEAIGVYLSLALSRVAMGCNSLARWNGVGQKVQHCFGRQALPMIWDFADPNPFTESTGSWASGFKYVADPLDMGGISPLKQGTVQQKDAVIPVASNGFIVSTDPPYYDNVGYADLSDFFYVWLRPRLREMFATIFGTMLVPKTPELVAAANRFGGNKELAKEHFETGLFKAFTNARSVVREDFPLTVYYAFKQSETTDDSDDEVEINTETFSNSGWETILDGLIRARFSVVGTWPIRTEMRTRLVAAGTNALASSIVLVCRPRPDDAPTISRRQFVDELKRDLPAALKNLQSGNIAPVDLAQASIGPGMAVYSRYKSVLEADGRPLTVRAALGLINQELDAYLAEQDGEIDPDTRFALAWFEQFAYNEGAFGQADVLARAKNTSVQGVTEAYIARSGQGKVALYPPSALYELNADWNPAADKRPTVWEATHHLIERLNRHGESGAAGLLLKLPDALASEARALGYRLYNICERKGWAELARDYNALVISWPQLVALAAEQRERTRDQGTQGRLFE